MEKNFAKIQTPPRSSGSHLDAFNAQVEQQAGISPPLAFQNNQSPTIRINSNQQEHPNNPIDIQFNSPRMSVNSLNQNFNKVDEYKYNFDPSYGGTDPALKTRNNSGSAGIPMAKNFPDHTLYNNSATASKNAMPIFIDDLEEETILDVTIKLKSFRSY